MEKNAILVGASMVTTGAAVFGVAAMIDSETDPYMTKVQRYQYAGIGMVSLGIAVLTFVHACRN